MISATRQQYCYVYYCLVLEGFVEQQRETLVGGNSAGGREVVGASIHIGCWNIPPKQCFEQHWL